MTHSTIKSIIKRNMGNNDELDTLLDRYVHLGKMRIAEEQNFRELIRVYEGTLPLAQRIKVPSRTKDIYWMAIAEYDGSDYSNTRLLKAEYNNQMIKDWPYPEEADDGMPSTYSWVQDYLVLRQKPDTAYNIRICVALWPEYITSGEHEFTNRDRLVIAASTAEGFQALGLETKAAYWNAVYSERMVYAKKSDATWAAGLTKMGGFNAQAPHIRGRMADNVAFVVST